MDAYMRHVVEEMLQRDSSHKPEMGNLGFLEIFRRPVSYSESEVRTMYEQAARIWFEQGYQYAAQGMNAISLHGNIENARHDMFYQQFLELCGKYNIRITYHPAHGMIFEDLLRGPEPTIYTPDLLDHAKRVLKENTGSVEPTIIKS